MINDKISQDWVFPLTEFFFGGLVTAFQSISRVENNVAIHRKAIIMNRMDEWAQLIGSTFFPLAFARMQLKSIRCSVIRRNFQSNLYVSFINQTIKNKKTKHVIALLHIYTARCSRYSFIHGCHSELNQQRIKQQTYRELMFHTHIFNNNIYWNRISIIRISPHIFDVYSRYTFGKSNAFIRKSRKKYVFVDGARSALSTQMKLFFVFFTSTQAHITCCAHYYFMYEWFIIICMIIMLSACIKMCTAVDMVIWLVFVPFSNAIDTFLSLALSLGAWWVL